MAALTFGLRQGRAIRSQPPGIWLQAAKAWKAA